jgi:hypothetical protein
MGVAHLGICRSLALPFQNRHGERKRGFRLPSFSVHRCRAANTASQPQPRLAGILNIAEFFDQVCKPEWPHRQTGKSRGVSAPDRSRPGNRGRACRSSLAALRTVFARRGWRTFGAARGRPLRLGARPGSGPDARPRGTKSAEAGHPAFGGLSRRRQPQRREPTRTGAVGWSVDAFSECFDSGVAAQRRSLLGGHRFPRPRASARIDRDAQRSVVVSVCSGTARCDP